MYTRTFVKGLLMPSIGVGVVHAKGEQDKDDCDDSKKLIRARELPLYVEPPKCVTCTNKIENDDGFLITTIRCARQEFQQIVGQARLIQVEAQNMVEEVKKETEDVVAYLRQEENLLPRLGAIGLGSFAGYLLACRKGLMKKTLYSAAGAGIIAAVAYPNQAKEYTEEVMCELKKYAVIGYHFLNGADVDWKKLEKIKPPCFSQSDGARKDSDRAGALRDGKDKAESKPKTPLPNKNLSLTGKEKAPPDPCVERIKASQKTGPDDKRSYMERCKERGACGIPRKKPAVNGDKSNTQCDLDCAGPKRGTRAKRNSKDFESSSSPVGRENGLPPSASQSRPQDGVSDPCNPASRTAVPIPQGKMQPDVGNCLAGGYPLKNEGRREDPCQPNQQPTRPNGSLFDRCKTRGKPGMSSQQCEITTDPCQTNGRAGASLPAGGNNVNQCPSNTPQPNETSTDPCQSSGNTFDPAKPPQSNLDDSNEGSVCRRKRRVTWYQRGNAEQINNSITPLNSEKAGDVEQSPIISRVAEAKQEHNTVSGHTVNSHQLGNNQLPEVNQLAVGNSSDTRKSPIKRSSVTITYPNPPRNADSRVIMNSNDTVPNAKSTMPPKGVTMKSPNLRPDVHTTEYRTNNHQNANIGSSSRQRKEDQSSMNQR